MFDKKQHSNMVQNIMFPVQALVIFNRPGVAGAVVQKPLK